MFVPVPFAPTGEILREFLRAHVFATVAGIIGGSIHFAYAPVVFDADVSDAGVSGPGGVRFHLARANPLAGLQEGAKVKLSILGPHAYVSPDWYETPDLVPTWNYLAAEGEGYLRYLNDQELSQLLADLTRQEEAALAMKTPPKAPWTLARMKPETLARMQAGIMGFALAFDTLEGKIKLSQNRARGDIMGVIAGLERRGDAASLAVAQAMRKHSLP